jgi:uncharacterized RDD family membrane protein YckC
MTQQPPLDPFTQPTAPGTGAPGTGAPGAYAGPPARGVGGPWGPLADWVTRVAAMLIDSLVQLVGMVPYVIGIVLFVVGAPDSGSDVVLSDSEYLPPDTGNAGLMILGGVLVGLGLLLMLAIQVWNRAFRQGRTGQSIGKKVMGIRLVDEHTGQPIGAGMAFVRDLAHVLDGFAYIGYLWPLWDDKRQTFADKVLNTVVVELPKSPAGQ